MKKQLDLKRLWQTFVREFALNKINILIMLASLTFLNLLLSYISQRPYFPRMGWLTAGGFPVIALVYCMIITSSSFSELNTADRKIDFLMLPSSIIEKFIVKFIYTTVGFLLLSYVALSLSAMIIEIYRYLFPNAGLFKRMFHTYSHFNFGGFLQVYFALHSLFFFGAIYFKKLELGKTFLAFGGLFAALNIYLSLISLLPFFENVNTPLEILNIPLQINVNAELSIQSWHKITALNSTVKEIVLFVLLYFMPVFFWALSFIRLQENEVADGV
jgi:hypothetical protein